jgi:hypothetical protein
MSDQEHKPLSQEERMDALRTYELMKVMIEADDPGSPAEIMRRALLDLEAVERQRDAYRKVAEEAVACVERDYGLGVNNGYWPTVAPLLKRWRAALSGAVEAPPAGEGAVAP